MIQNFNPRERESERNFDYQGRYEEINTHDQNHTACSTPNPPWWCEEQAPTANVDIYTPMLIVIAFVIGLIKLQKFIKWKENEF